MTDIGGEMLRYRWSEICKVTDIFALRAVFSDTSDEGKKRVQVTMPDLLEFWTESNPLPHPWHHNKEDVLSVLANASVESGIRTICAMVHCPCVRVVSTLDGDQSAEDYFGESCSLLPGWENWIVVGCDYATEEENMNIGVCEGSFHNEVFILVPRAVFE